MRDQSWLATLDRYLVPGALAATLLGFCWSLVMTNDFQRSFLLVAKVIVPAFAALKLWLRHALRVHRSGLTESQFLVREAGGPSGVRRQAFRLRALGWVTIGLPCAFFVWLWISEDLAAGLVAILTILICIPVAAVLFWHARKLSRMAKEGAP